MNANGESIFTRIIKGEIPAHKIYEDDRTLAFLSIQPLQPGHTLVIPKKQVEFVWDLPEDDYRAVMDTAKKVANRIKAVLDPPYVGEMVSGVQVPHAHVHLIPFSDEGDLRAAPPDHAADAEELAAIAKKLKF